MSRSDDPADLSHLPGDAGLPLLGCTHRFLADPVGFDRALAAEHGPVARTRLFGQDLVALSGADLNTEVLLDRDRALSNAGGWGRMLEELLPRGLLLRDFEDHRRHRRIMQKAFTTSALRACLDILNPLSARTVEGWLAEGSLRFYPALKRALLELASLVFLGAPLGERAEALASACGDLSDAATVAMRWDLPLTKWRRGLEGRRVLVEFLAAEVPRRRGAEGTDLLTLLCNAQDDDGDQFEDGEVVDHMVFLLQAAHDTTATGLTTLLRELLRAPSWQARLRVPCQEVLDLEAGVPWEALDRLELVDMAFREALRMNPPIRYLLRQARQPCALGGQALPEGAQLTLVVDAAHRDPALWTDPERFDPLRFSPERAEHKRHKHAWIPFGGGAHACIGMRFALLQARLFMAHLLGRARVSSPTGGEGDWRYTPVPQPADGLPITLARV
ncbi:MAG: cytochrome P450 [Alphaproteobacteria bacterium]|nr:cytochrome P450 [Alphaproteobacteria bacterium]